MPFDFSTRRYISPTEQGGTPAVLTPTTIPPSIVSQTIYPPEGYDGFNKVVVPGVSLESLTIDPSTSSQSFNPSGTNLGFNTITVNPVTANIDQNLTAGNIKEGIQILGINGIASINSPLGARYIIRENGMAEYVNNLNGYFDSITRIQSPSTFQYAFFNCRNLQGDITFNSLLDTVDNTGWWFDHALSSTNISSLSMPKLRNMSSSWRQIANSCQYCSKLTTVNFASLEQLPYGVFENAFLSCSNLTNVNFDSAIYYDSFAFSQTFQNCTKLQTINIDKLCSPLRNDSSEYLFVNAFWGCANLQTASFKDLRNASSTMFSSMFFNCRNLTSVNFDGLQNIYTTYGYTFSTTFNGCSKLKEIHFPSLMTITSGYGGSFPYAFRNSAITNVYFEGLINATPINTFSAMLYGKNGVTVHFPASIESLIGEWPNVLSGFGGNNTTVLFDLLPITNDFSNIYNIDSSGTIGESSFAVDTEYDATNAYLAFTLDNSTGWQSKENSNERYIKMYYNKGSFIENINIYTSNSVNVTTNIPNVYDIYLSNDNVNWWKPRIDVNTSIETNGGWVNVTVLNPKYSNYCKICFTPYENDYEYLTTINRIHLNGAYKYQNNN